MPRLAIIFHHFGPYHWARVNAVARVMPTIALELSAQTKEYAWSRLVKPHSELVFETLYTHGDSRQLSGKRMLELVSTALDRHAPDAVAVPGWAGTGALAAFAWCAARGRSIIVMSESQEQDFSRSWPTEFVKRRLISLAGKGLVGGRRHLDYLAKLGMPPSDIVLGYDVVDNDWFFQGATRARAQAAEQRQRLALPLHYFFASMRFIPKKNLEGLLRAYAMYRERAGADAWSLVLTGDGELRPALHELRAALRLEEHVYMPGFKQYDELPAYYGLAQAFIHPSTTEQWGLVVNEAMAAGLPVLVSDRCGCAPDLVEDGVNGYVFDPYDISAMADKMWLMASVRSDLEKMGQESRRIIAKWSPETFANNLRAVSVAACQGRARPARIHDRLLVRALIGA